MMQIDSIVANVLKFLGFLVLVVAVLFLMAKLTHQTLVISSSHIYLGGTSEIAPQPDGGNY